MRSILPRAVLVIALSLVLAGGRVAPLYDAIDVAYGVGPRSTAKQYSLDDYRAAIIRAGAKRGWIFTDERPGHLIGNIIVRGKHFVEIDVKFNTENFSINYKSSRNLNYDPVRYEIHPNYNSWITNLEQDIQIEVVRMKSS
ncbi:MAG: hypothetical protein RQ752_10685 [Thermohalobaculum sp.]|nr:hypothetical protein [Thermohalobaculum sp.]